MEKEAKASLIATVVGAALIVGLVSALYPSSFSASSSDNSENKSSSTSTDDKNNIIHIPTSTPPDNDIGIPGSTSSVTK